MQMHTKTLAPIFAMLSVGITAPAAANLKPGSFITKDGAEITPTLQTGLSSNNNFFTTPENKESRLIWTIKPNVKAVIEFS